MHDLIGVVDAGYGTLFYAIANIMTRLKQHPDIMQKLLKDLNENGVRAEVFKPDGFSTEESYKLIQR